MAKQTSSADHLRVVFIPVQGVGSESASKRAWCVKINGRLMRDRRGVARRFESAHAALKAAESLFEYR